MGNWSYFTLLIGAEKVWRHCEVPRLGKNKASGNPPHRVCDAPWLHHAAKPPHLSCAVDRLRFVAGTAAQLQRHSDCGNASVRTVPRLAAQCQTTQAMLTERFCKCQGLCWAQRLDRVDAQALVAANDCAYCLAPCSVAAFMAPYSCMRSRAKRIHESWSCNAETASAIHQTLHRSSDSRCTIANGARNSVALQKCRPPSFTGEFTAIASFPSVVAIALSSAGQRMSDAVVPLLHRHSETPAKHEVHWSPISETASATKPMSIACFASSMQMPSQDACMLGLSRRLLLAHSASESSSATRTLRSLNSVSLPSRRACDGTHELLSVLRMQDAPQPCSGNAITSSQRCQLESAVAVASCSLRRRKNQVQAQTSRCLWGPQSTCSFWSWQMTEAIADWRRLLAMVVHITRGKQVPRSRKLRCKAQSTPRSKWQLATVSRVPQSRWTLKATLTKSPMSRWKAPRCFECVQDWHLRNASSTSIDMTAGKALPSQKWLCWELRLPWIS